MRLFRVLSIVLVGIVLTGVLVLIVVEISDYDGRTPAEIARGERGEDPTASEHCPREELGNSEEEHDPGTEGDTVPPGPTSALLCRWTYGRRQRLALTETVLHSRGDLTELTDALDSLPPVTPLPEGVYDCESEPSYYVLIGLRYEGSSEVQVGIGPGVCGGDAALNLQDQQEYEDTPRLLRLLDALLEKRS